MRLSIIPLARAAVVLTTVALTPVAWAQHRVTGFESGDPAVASHLGDASTVGTFEGDAPTEGTQQYLITTISANDGDGQTPVSGSDAVAHPGLQNYMGGLSLADQEGSGFKLTLTVNPGEGSISFDWNFLTNDTRTTAGGDTAFFALYDSANNLVSTGNIANVTNATNVNSTGNPFAFDSGYHTKTISIASPGTYTLGIGIFDRGDLTLNSGLLVDNVQVVPEPSTVGLALGGAALLLAVRRRIKGS